MPNHITNHLGFDTRVQEIRDFLKGDNSLIDFNKIRPMPEILNKIVSGSMRTENGGHLENYVREAVKADSVTFTEVEKGIFKTDDGCYKTDAFCEVRAKAEDEVFIARAPNAEEVAELEKIGCPTWYEWGIKNWGTKWNAYDQEEISPNKIKFETAWNGVVALMTELSKRFPDVTFTYEYADEDTGYNVGTGFIKDGVSRVQALDKGSPQAYELAFKLMPDRAENYVLIDGKYTYKDED